MTYPLDDDCELPPRLIEIFLRTAPLQLKDLVDACRQHDTEAARAHAHKLQGGLYAAGASRLADGLATLRAAAAANDWVKVSLQLDQAREDFASVIEQWRARLEDGT